MRYEIKGDALPVAICYLENGEAMVSESGAMSWMSPNMLMETNGTGGIGKMFGRAFSGESMFLNTYTANGNGLIAFASKMPGSIRAVRIEPGRSIVVQKRAFLACTTGIKTEITFQKRFGAGFFGGEGFIMQKIYGDGVVFLEIDGYAVEYELAAGQSMVCDTGYLACMDESCTMDVKTISGVKNVLFGGEGLFNTVVTGPGKIVIQSMPLSKLAGTIGSALPRSPK